MIYTFVLSFMFAEECLSSYLPLTCQAEFDNEEEALKDLAITLHNTFMEKHSLKCCQESAKDDKASYCSKCGKKIQYLETEVKELGYDTYEFTNWLIEMAKSNYDAMGSYLGDGGKGKWVLADLEYAENPIFVYQAERIFLCILDIDKFKKFEAICEIRKKNEDACFSFYEL